ncbi:MAG: glycosyltransferase family 2 protein [Patescibacteria group bacterium]|nr:glycosyltransferase family 2 protein [Patescibacteria group bacterium]
MRNIEAAVIIVNWNGKKYLKDCFDSLERQTDKNFKVIFVDNGSEDDSVVFVRDKYLETKFPSLDIIELEKNTGFCFGYNAGIKKALEDESIKYVIILNNDTKLDEKYIEELTNCAERHPDAGSIQPKIFNFYEQNKIDCAGIYITRDGTAHNRGYGKNEEKYSEEKEIFGANGTASLFTRDALEKTALPGHNYFDNDHFAFYEDVDLAWRMKNAGFRSYYCPKAVVYHVHSGTAGKASLMKAYYLHRNYFFTIFKNYPCRKLAKTLFWRFISYTRLVLNVFRGKKREAEFVSGNSKGRVAIVILKAWVSVIWNFPKILARRRFIKKKLHEIQI